MRLHRTTHAAAALLVAAGVLTGCQNNEASAKSSSSVNYTKETSDLSDANIVALLDAANAADSTLGAEARPMLTTDAAKGYARMMMHDHHELREKVSHLAKKENITAEMPTDDPFRTAVDAERAAMHHSRKGHAVDSTYIANEIEIHSAVINWAANAEVEAHNAELKELIKSAGTELKKHLDRATEIQHKRAM